MTLIVQNTIDPNLFATLATTATSQTVSNKTLKAIKEPVTITNSTPASTTNFDVATQSISVYNQATTNFTINVRGSETQQLNAILAVGESVTINLFVPNGSTAYYPNTIKIDGAIVTPRYQGGAAFTSGNANSVDLYVLFIVKVNSDPSYQVYISQTKFA